MMDGIMDVLERVWVEDPMEIEIQYIGYPRVRREGRCVAGSVHDIVEQAQLADRWEENAVLTLASSGGGIEAQGNEGSWWRGCIGWRRTAGETVSGSAPFFSSYL